MDEGGLSEVKVYGVALHAHLAAVKVHIRHFRNDTELTPWIVDNNYDFNFQRYIFFKEEITLLPVKSISFIWIQFNIKGMCCISIAYTR